MMNLEIKKLIEEIFPFRRMINSFGMDKAFEVVKANLPNLIVHEYQPKETADDWEVPYGWELVRAEVRDVNGKLIASDRDSHLIVAAYSEPVSGIFSKEEISKHVRCHPILKDAYFMEHRNAYNYSLVDWGITLPQQLWDSMQDEYYSILVEVEKDFNRSMKVGEYIIHGQTDYIISFTAHIDELCNDNLSSCAVLIELFKNLSADKNFKPFYTYQLLLIPEVIGTYFYVRNNLDVVRRIKSMINLETVGRGEEWIIKQSLRGDKYIDKLMILASKEILMNYKVTNMFGGYGNEERVFEYPTIKIPSVAIQRFPFDEYHSSCDTPDKLSDEYLNQAFAFVNYLVQLIERDFIPEYTYILPPWLTKHGLYFDSKDQPELFEVFMNQVQYNIDGCNSLVDLCFKYDISFEILHDYLNQFVGKKFIQKKSTYEIW